MCQTSPLAAPQDIAGVVVCSFDAVALHACSHARLTVPSSSSSHHHPTTICTSASLIAFGAAIIANPTLATFDASLEKLCNQFGTTPGVWFTFQGTGERVTVMQISDEAEVTLHQGTTCGAAIDTHVCV
jgi:hypothetical protein